MSCPLLVGALIVAFFPFYSAFAPSVSSYPRKSGQLVIYLVRERWHTGLILPSELAQRCIPEVAQLPSTPWVDFGWGEADFYQTPGFHLRLALKAILRRNESVLRIAAVPSDLQRYYGHNSWIRPLCIDSVTAERLCTFLSHTIFRDSTGSAILTSAHAGGWIRFYKAQGTYWGLQTCNTWVAQALNFAGLRLRWQGIVVAEQLFAAISHYPCHTSP